MVELAVLTAAPELPLYRELVQAGESLSVPVHVWDSTRMAASLPGEVLLDGVPVATHRVACFLPRVGNFRPESTLALVAALERQGCLPFNPPGAIRIARDHWLTVERLHRAGIPHPPTVVGSDPQVLARCGQTMGFPVVVKARRSRQGVGVICCHSLAELEAVLDTLWRLGEEVVLQRFCPPGGESFRALVLEGDVVGFTRHEAAPGEFRTNAARGGVVTPWEGSPQLHQLARAAAAACGLRLCGVDLWPDGDRLVVGEVNPTPGWKHFAAATGIPVAQLVVEAMVRRAALGADP
ncbi:MAG: RimK family alpha-L-glutamate ligase [Thermoanaerobaculum sp.]|nr:RimK family alpha-L-glutamate ligase [Thermoanaerobaculum sp.]MDW7966748.1 RimK family alpha-L-glutamate ligase [Thermoanaerobaculum sp.]